MAVMQWELDPTSEVATNVPLVLNDFTTWRVTEMDISPPDIDPLLASSPDSEGDPLVRAKHKNRSIALTLMAKTNTDAATQLAVNQLMAKIDKMRREQGTIKFTTIAGSAVVADVLYASPRTKITPELIVANKAVEVTVDFQCDPYFRGPAQLLTDHVETTLPVLIFTEPNLQGDVGGIGVATFDEDQGVNQNWMVWGVEDDAEYDITAATGKLFYEAEALTRLNQSTATAVAGASGGTVVQGPLNGGLKSIYQGVLSTQLNGGNHLTHVGSFRFFARVGIVSSGGDVDIALDWSVGDFRTFQRNDPATVSDGFSVGTQFVDVDLGLVHLPAPATGTQRWEGRIVSKNPGVSVQSLRVDCIWLVPTKWSSGEASAWDQLPVPQTFIAADDFSANFIGTAISGNFVQIGGTWAETGPSPPFIADSTNFVVNRTANNDGGAVLGHFALAGTATPAIIAGQCDVTINPSTTEAGQTGLTLRYVDGLNFARANIFRGYSAPNFNVFVEVGMYVAATPTVIVQKFLGRFLPSGQLSFSIRAYLDATGRVALWYSIGAGGAWQLAGVRTAIAALATGGALDDGRIGLHDYATGSAPSVRTIDNVQFWQPVPDAAMFASQSLRLTGQDVSREDSAGAIWVKPSIFEGDYLLLPPGGREGRDARVIVKAARELPLLGPDGGIDDISARISYVPRYLNLP